MIYGIVLRKLSLERIIIFNVSMGVVVPSDVVLVETGQKSPIVFAPRSGTSWQAGVQPVSNDGLVI